MDWDEIGTTDKPGLNPPSLDGTDSFALAWFGRNVNNFIKDFNLMPQMLTQLKLNGTERELFIHKLGMIYETNLRIAQQEIKHG